MSVDMTYSWAEMAINIVIQAHQEHVQSGLSFYSFFALTEINQFRNVTEN
jgi:hypothetical protein